MALPANIRLTIRGVQVHPHRRRNYCVVLAKVPPGVGRIYAVNNVTHLTDFFLSLMAIKST